MLLFHLDEGAGPPVVLVHAGVADGRVWAPQAAVLSRDRHVLRPDLRGFGRSPLPPEPYSHAADVLALLDHLDLAAADVVGSSFGGQVALEVAQAAPERVSSLLLLCPAFAGLEPSPQAAEFGRREDELLRAGDIDAAVELNVATWVGPEATAEGRDLVRRMQRHAFEVQLAADADPDFPWPDPVDVDPAQLSAPTLVVSGALDMDHFRDVARHLAATIPGAELVTLPWAGHLPGLERPLATAELMHEFLASWHR